MATKTEENNKPAIIIMVGAAALYAAVYFWYISIPLLIIFGVILYTAYKRNMKFQERVNSKISGFWLKIKTFMKR